MSHDATIQKEKTIWVSVRRYTPNFKAEHKEQVRLVCQYYI